VQKNTAKEKAKPSCVTKAFDFWDWDWLKHEQQRWILATGSEISLFQERLIFYHQHHQPNREIQWFFQQEDIFIQTISSSQQQDLFSENSHEKNKTNKKIYVITDVTESSHKKYTEIIPLVEQNCHLILLGAEVKYSGTFVTECAAAIKKHHQEDLVKIRCYSSSLRDRIKFLTEDVKYIYRRNMDTEAAEWFSETKMKQQGWSGLLRTVCLYRQLKKNHPIVQTCNQESLEKLMIQNNKNEKKPRLSFAHEENESLTLEHFYPFCTDTDQFLGQELSSFFNKNLLHWIEYILNLKEEEGLVLCWLMIKKLIILLEARIRIDEGMTFLESIQKITPPLYFQKLEEMKYHVNLWGGNEIRFALQGLWRIEIMIKKGSPWWKSIFIELLKKIKG
jgi:hypothetical protein